MSELLQQAAGVSCPVSAIHLSSSGQHETLQAVAEEVPLALRYNGFSHAVMMVTPADLEDFALGFSLSERMIERASDIRALRVDATDDGLIAEIELVSASLHRFLAARRIRQIEGRTGCGLCGVEDLADVRQQTQRVQASTPPDATAIQRAVQSIRDFQPLSRGTRAAHAAAWVGLDGSIMAVREDVGRHNALDKLIGAHLRGAFDATSGFCLITSRCSFEMAQKAIAAGFSTLVSVSAPTAYAVRTAEAAGLQLYSLSREGGHFLYTGRRTLEDLSHGGETQART